MNDELMLVKQLEKETGIELKRVPLDAFMTRDNAFAADDNGRVRGLAIWYKKLPRLPALFSKFQRLEKLRLGDNQISDISSLKELKN